MCQPARSPRVTRSYQCRLVEIARRQRRTSTACRVAGGTKNVLPKAAGARHDLVMTKYADYCPIALGVDVLGFNEIHRGIPRMSRTLLAQRLRQLEKQGLITREAGRPGTANRYELTPAGEGLVPIVWAMGAWASEWCFSDPKDEDCDGI